MPEFISVEEFISETLEDYSSPTTSAFTTKMISCRNSVNNIEEVSLSERAFSGWLIIVTVLYDC